MCFFCLKQTVKEIVVLMCFDADSVVEPVFQNEQRTQEKELTTTILPSIGPLYRAQSKIPVSVCIEYSIRSWFGFGLDRPYSRFESLEPIF